jgi:hypothetical protein
MARWKIINLPTYIDFRGELNAIEQGVDISFVIQRVYFIKNVEPGECRGQHAHRALEQVIVPISGEFDIDLDDGINKEKIKLCSSRIGLYVGPMVYRTLTNFSSDAVCLVLASTHYDEGDYVRGYEEFMNAQS